MPFGRSDKSKIRQVFAATLPWLVWLSVHAASHAETAAADDQGASGQAGSPQDAVQDKPPLWALSSFDLGFGASDESGKFGAAKNTNIAAALTTATYRVDNIRLSASIPWMRIDSPGAVFTGIQGSPIIANPGSTGGKTLREGWGDLTVGASYLLPEVPFLGVDTDLSVRVKLPTASRSSQLSTGEIDSSVGATFSKSLGRYSPLISVFYRHFGDGPEFQLKDGFATSFGTTYAFSSRVIGFLTYDFSQRASQYIGDGHQITTSLTALLPRSPVRLTGFASAGLSHGAPGISAGLSFSLKL